MQSEKLPFLDISEQFLGKLRILYGNVWRCETFKNDFLSVDLEYILNTDPVKKVNFSKIPTNISKPPFADPCYNYYKILKLIKAAHKF